MKTIRIIEINGFTNKNTATLWDGKQIDTHTSYNGDDFDFGEDAEKELDKCKAYIKRKEDTEGWIEGNVTCWINEYTFEEID